MNPKDYRVSTSASRRAIYSQSPLQIYLQDINNTALLTIDEEQQLAERVAQGDPEAREHMVKANLRLVVNIARGYLGKGLGLEDLIEEGNLGLLRAVEGFDGGMNVRFSTYASYWIKQSIRRAVMNNGKPIRLPAYMVSLLAKWRRVSVALADRLGRPPTPEEVGKVLRLSRKKVGIVVQAIRANSLTPHSEGTEGEPQALDAILTDERSRSPEDLMIEADDLDRIFGRIDQLDDREASVIRMRFGLEPYTPMTLREVGENLGLTRERVRQLEGQALNKLVASLREVHTESIPAVEGEAVKIKKNKINDDGRTAKEESEKILARVDSLGEREAIVIRMRFGLPPYKPMTLREVGENLGLTRERVRQLESQALAHLMSNSDHDSNSPSGKCSPRDRFLQVLSSASTNSYAQPLRSSPTQYANSARREAAVTSVSASALELAGLPKHSRVDLANRPRVDVYCEAGLEFATAMEEYKRESGRMFPTWSEVLSVLQKLGYENSHSTKPPWAPHHSRDGGNRASHLGNEAALRRRGVDPTTASRSYTEADLEFMKAMEDYKARTGRMFPTWSEVIGVVADLGYQRSKLD